MFTLFATVLLVMVSGIGLLSAADVQKEGADKKELEKFQGRWLFVSSMVDGQAAPAAEIKDRGLVIKGEKAIFTYQGKAVGTVAMKLDPSKRPAQIDLTYADGPLKGMTDKRIYKFEGHTLTFCYRGLGKARPTAFASKPGSGLFLEVLKRAK
jgi:uncharacterized protein (TIGR03067 family)